MAVKEIFFRGSIGVEGDVDMEKLADYLQDAVTIDLDTEGQGDLSDDAEVTGIYIDWESLQNQPYRD
jgi:hypothetical protein